jgi:hypothetical protein
VSQRTLIEDVASVESQDQVRGTDLRMAPGPSFFDSADDRASRLFRESIEHLHLRAKRLIRVNTGHQPAQPSVCGASYTGGIS